MHKVAMLKVSMHKAIQAMAALLPMYLAVRVPHRSHRPFPHPPLLRGLPMDFRSIVNSIVIARLSLGRGR